MSRKFTFVLLMAMGCALGSLAQIAAPMSQAKFAPPLKQKTFAEQQKALAEVRAKYPALRMKLRQQPMSSAFQQAASSRLLIGGAPISAATVPLRSSGNTTLWGNTVANSDLNYFAFQPAASLTFTPLVESGQNWYVGNYGAGYKDGHIRGIYADLTYIDYGLVFEYFNDLDLETGAFSSSDLSDYSLMATETAIAPDGTVYGAFYTDDLTGIELGTIDYESLTRTTIGATQHFYIAMGMTKAGVLYGIAADDGNLYRIDTTNGAETLVGNTGVTLADEEGYYYGQSGEIDQKDDTFYWYSIDANDVAALYTVDLATGEVTKISDEQHQVFGLIVPAPEAADGAPAKLTDLAADFCGGTLTGQLTFTAPSTTFAGEPLSGQLTYTVYEDGMTVATGTTTASALTTATITLPAGGLHTFIVTTSNSVGESPKASVTAWVGLDVPSAVSNLQFSIDDNKLATLSWEAPTVGTHGGNVGTLTYDVYRVSGQDTVAVATSLSTTTITDQIASDDLAYYVYLVYAKNSSYTSAAAASEGKLVGNAITPDWTEDFLSETAMRFFTVIDGNQDGASWEYYTDEQAARSWYSSLGGNDDWLITPPIHLKADRSYVFSFSAKNKLAGYANCMEVKWGCMATPEGMTTTLLETTYPSSNGYQDYSYEVQPATDGDYYFGFHDNTPMADQYFVAIGYVSVKANALTTSPDSVMGMTIVPAAQGALAATVSFMAPRTSIGGEPLAAIDSIVVTRNGQRVKTFDAPTSGESLSLNDVVTASAVYEYAVTPYIGAEYGRTVKASAYIGRDIPQDPTDVALKDNITNVVAQWDESSVVGANGGYVDPAGVKVSLYGIESTFVGYAVGDLVASSGAGETSLTLAQDPEKNPEGYNYQKLLQYFAQATNDVGGSSFVGTHTLVVGPTLSLPFKESLSKGAVDNGFAWLERNEQSEREDGATWQLVTNQSVDADGGSALWAPYINYYYTYDIKPGDEASLNMPKVSLAAAANPVLFFSLYAKEHEQAKLKVLVQRPDGSEQTAAIFDLSSVTETGWTTKSVSLSEFKDARYAIVKFRGVSEGDDTYIGLDNINIIDQKEHDLEAVSLSVPAKATAGATSNVVVGLRNLGAQTAKDYSVVLYAQGEPVDTVEVVDELQPFATTSVALSLPVKITASDALDVSARVVYASDLDLTNNDTEVKTLTVVQPNAVTVSDLSATDEDGVVLSWSQPTAPEGETLTETFENYDNFVTEFGNWTTIDNTESTINTGYFSSNAYEHQGEPFAFIVFNPSEYSEGFDALYYIPGLGAHDGYKYAACPKKQSTLTYDFVDGDSWLISPSLSGNAQIVSFYAYNVYYSDVLYAESFEVLTSATDAAPSSFTKLGQTMTAAGTTLVGEGSNWTEFSVDIPEGTKYFAIHHVTPADDCFLFGLDDITYEKGAVLDAIVGYRVYRDGVLVATVDGQTTAYTDVTDDGLQHTYNVTVVYEDASGSRYESAFSNSATIATSIAAIENSLKATSYDIYTLDGKAVMLDAKSLKGLQKGMYIINERKFILK